jgi:hypothetical protein
MMLFKVQDYVDSVVTFNISTKLYCFGLDIYAVKLHITRKYNCAVSIYREGLYLGHQQTYDIYENCEFQRQIL